tara:strand:- start:125 stop:346 length:222 start_codon:yes stop_codon:yes gene_type:complete
MVSHTLGSIWVIVSSNLARPFEVDVQVVVLVVDQPTDTLIFYRTVTPSAGPFYCHIVAPVVVVYPKTPHKRGA